MNRRNTLPIALFTLLLAVSVSAAPNFSEVARLSTKTSAERGNLKLILTPLETASPEVRQAAREAMDLWNTGEYDAAMAVLDELDYEEAARNIEITGNWREPIPTASPEFDADVRVGTRDSVLSVDIEIHRPSGVLWAVYLIRGDFERNWWVANRSADGGATWVEHGYSYNSADFMYDVACVVSNDYLYIVYEWNDAVRFQKYNGDVGGSVRLGNGLYSAEIYSLANPNEGVRKIVAVSDEDHPSGHGSVYVVSLTNHGNLHLDVNAAPNPDVVWDHRYTGVTDAYRGLSACYNSGATGFDGPWVYISYLTQDDELHVDGLTTDEEHYTALLEIDAIDSKARVTSIAAYDQKAIVAFEKGGDSRRLVYAYSSTAGDTWWASFFLDDNFTGGEMPAICGRAGGGFGFVYTAYSTPYVSGPRFKWTSYGAIGGTQLEPARVFANHFGGPVQPDIVYLGDGDFGMIYVSDLDDGKAYFDRGAYCCRDRVGDANGSGDDEPTIGDVSLMIDAKFITSSCVGMLHCLEEADVNQSGGVDPICDDISIGDVSMLIDYLFITGPATATLSDCL